MKQSWYSIRNTSATAAEITIYEEIGMRGITAKDFLDQFKSIGERHITLRLNSPGGSIFDGLSIYNRLREHKAGVTVRIDGLAASMASVIAMAGAPVCMAENALLMIHNPSGLVMGEASDMRDTADLLDKLRGSLLTAYERKTGMSSEKLTAMLTAETWLDAQEALDLGFIDEITEPLKAAASFDMSRFRNPPPPMSIFSKSPKPEDVVAQLEADLATATASIASLTGERDAVSDHALTLEATLRDTIADRDAATAQVTALTLTHDTFSASIRAALQLPAESDLAPEAIATAITALAQRQAVEMGASVGIPALPAQPAESSPVAVDLAELAAAVRDAATPADRARAFAAWKAASQPAAPVS